MNLGTVPSSAPPDRNGVQGLHPRSDKRYSSRLLQICGSVFTLVQITGTSQPRFRSSAPHLLPDTNTTRLVLHRILKVSHPPLTNALLRSYPKPSQRPFIPVCCRPPRARRFRPRERTKTRAQSTCDAEEEEGKGFHHRRGTCTCTCVCIRIHIDFRRLGRRQRGG